MKVKCPPVPIKSVCPPPIESTIIYKEPTPFFIPIEQQFTSNQNEVYNIKIKMNSHYGFLLTGIIGDKLGASSGSKNGVFLKLNQNNKQYFYGDVQDRFFEFSPYRAMWGEIFKFPAPIFFPNNSILNLELSNKDTNYVNKTYQSILTGLLIPQGVNIKNNKKELRIIGFYKNESVKIGEDIYVTDVLDAVLIGNTHKLLKINDKAFSNVASVYTTKGNKHVRLNPPLKLNAGIITLQNISDANSGILLLIGYTEVE